MIIITNGDYTYGAVWDKNNEEYYYVEELPNYQELTSNGEFKLIYDEKEGWQRPNFSDLLSKETIESFFQLGWIGEDTNKVLYQLIINLAGFLHDSSIKCSPIDLFGLCIIADGHRYTSFGNASGGSWEGDYRYFILEDEESNNQIISISIFGTLSCINHSKYGNRKGHTALIVAIDDFDRRHNSLQLNIDKHTIIQGSKYTIWHDGTLTVGKKGAAKRKEVISYIKSQDPSMVNSSGKIILGTLDCSKEIQWNQKDTKKFIINLIKYAILRDEFRRIK